MIIIQLLWELMIIFPLVWFVFFIKRIPTVVIDRLLKFLAICIEERNFSSSGLAFSGCGTEIQTFYGAGQ